MAERVLALWRFGLLLRHPELKLHTALLMIIQRTIKRIRSGGEINLKLPGSTQFQG